MPRRPQRAIKAKPGHNPASSVPLKPFPIGTARGQHSLVKMYLIWAKERGEIGRLRGLAAQTPEKNWKHKTIEDALRRTVEGYITKNFLGITRGRIISEQFPKLLLSDLSGDVKANSLVMMLERESKNRGEAIAKAISLVEHAQGRAKEILSAANSLRKPHLAREHYYRSNAMDAFGQLGATYTAPIEYMLENLRRMQG